MRMFSGVCGLEAATGVSLVVVKTSPNVFHTLTILFLDGRKIMSRNFFPSFTLGDHLPVVVNITDFASSFPFCNFLTNSFPLYCFPILFETPFPELALILGFTVGGLVGIMKSSAIVQVTLAYLA